MEAEPWDGGVCQLIVPLFIQVTTNLTRTVIEEICEECGCNPYSIITEAGYTCFDSNPQFITLHTKLQGNITHTASAIASCAEERSIGMEIMSNLSIIDSTVLKNQPNGSCTPNDTHIPIQTTETTEVGITMEMTTDNGSRALFPSCNTIMVILSMVLFEKCL